jgi:hypothetical protein
MGVISKTFAHRANHRLPSFVTLKIRLYWCEEDPQAARRAAKSLNGPGTNPLMVADPVVLRTGEFRLKSGINVAPTDYPLTNHLPVRYSPPPAGRSTIVFHQMAGVAF